jgi:hypothetical protein
MSLRKKLLGNAFKNDSLFLWTKSWPGYVTPGFQADASMENREVVTRGMLDIMYSR